MTTESGDFSLRSRLRTIQRMRAVRGVKSNLRAVRQLGPATWRLATSSRRALPSVVIVGAQKAGTTQLYASMVRHPACFGGVKKEVQYFSKNPNKSLAWYRSHFPLAETVAAANGICLEASPSYLPSPAALERMHRVLPNAKVIVLLRDPVSRAFSHYQHYKTRQLETRTFADAVDDILSGRPENFLQQWVQQDRPDPLYDYIARGYYALQLEALWQFYDRKELLVIDSGDLFADTDATSQRVFDFVGLERYPVPPKKILNRGHYREKIDPSVAERLREHYRSHNERLLQLLGRPTQWMVGEGHRESA